MSEKDVDQKSKKSREPFFIIAIIGFFIILCATLFMCFYDEFTEKRVAMILLNSWFLLFSMDAYTNKLKKEHKQQAFWEDWFIFSKKAVQEAQKEEVDRPEKLPEENERINPPKKDGTY